MLTALIRQNVDQHPERQADFERLRGSIVLEATDAEVAVTMYFLGGGLRVHGGVQGRPDIAISTDSLTLLELAGARLRFGLPDPAHPSGRAVLRKLGSGKLRIKGSGLVLKPLLLVRFTKLLNVALG